MTEPAPDLNAIHSRVLNAADKLFEALEDLEAAGGFAKLGEVMRPKALARTAEVLKSTRQAIDGQLARPKASKGRDVTGPGPGADPTNPKEAP